MENTIQTVKEIRDTETNELTGYLVDGMSVPLAEGNRHYREVQEWIEEGGVVEEAYTEEELAKQEIDRKIAEAKAYLAATGWIWEKYNRNVLVLNDMTTEEFSLKYSDIISKQEEYRLLINELEVQVPNG